MAISEFTAALGEAYLLDQVQNAREQAVTKLRSAIQDPEGKKLAKAEYDRLAEAMRHPDFGRRRCHISKTNHDLLKEALA